jgi:D-aminopeptidase
VQRHPALAERWLLPVVGETWDGDLNDVNGQHITVEAGIRALETAASGAVAEGAVGGGTGMICYGFKGGSGTASRLVEYAGGSYAVGVFVQANFGAMDELRLAGVPVGRLVHPGSEPAAEMPPPGAGSVIAIVGTDAPLLPGQCKALARRVSLGLARTGTVSSHFSGDLFLAFSTGNPGAITVRAADPAKPFDVLRFVPWGYLRPFYAAVVQATEEAVANALAAGQDMTGRDGHFVPGLPAAQVAELMKTSPMRGRES